MALKKPDLHTTFIDSIKDIVISHSDVNEKPLCLDLLLPATLKLRVYIFNSGNPPGGRFNGEYKITLNVGQDYGCRGNFDYSDGRFVLIIGYVEKYDVFILWDAEMHTDFSFNKNLQVKPNTVLEALVNSIVCQPRSTKNGTEVIIAATSSNLKKAIKKRIDLTIKHLLEN